MEGGLIDIAAQRFDAGVRLGEQVAKDMVSVRIGADVRFAVVGTKAYFAKHPAPKSPQDLIAHHASTCVCPHTGDCGPGNSNGMVVN